MTRAAVALREEHSCADRPWPTRAAASTNARQLEARVTLRDEAARLRGLSLRASVRPVARVPRPRRTTEVRWAFFVASVAQ
jgi:hypothetical protein